MFGKVTGWDTIIGFGGVKCNYNLTVDATDTALYIYTGGHKECYSSKYFATQCNENGNIREKLNAELINCLENIDIVRKNHNFLQ